MKQKSQPWYLLYAAAVVELDPKQLNAWHGDTFVNGPGAQVSASSDNGEEITIRAAL
jgi:hypothetical protein